MNRVGAATWISLALVAANAAPLATHLWLVAEGRRLQPLATGTVLPPLTGRTREGHPVSDDRRASAACHLVRYTNVTCHYCALDADLFRQLERDLTSAGCDSTVLAPMSFSFPAAVDGDQTRHLEIAFPSMDFVASARLRGTPTTILADARGVVLWAQVGPLEGTDVPEIVRVAVRARQGLTASVQAAASSSEGAAERAFAQWYARQPRVEIPLTRGARVQLLKFNDYQCPPCRRTSSDYGPLLDRYARERPGSVELVVKDFPLEKECNDAARGDTHPAACEAAASVRAARAHQRDGVMTEWLFAHQPSLSPASVRKAAQEVGRVPDFDARYAQLLDEIRSDVELGKQLAVQSTPTFFLNGVRLPSDVPPPELEAAIEYELGRTAKVASGDAVPAAR